MAKTVIPAARDHRLRCPTNIGNIFASAQIIGVGQRRCLPVCGAYESDINGMWAGWGERG
jgi:hypothetical protein